MNANKKKFKSKKKVAPLSLITGSDTIFIKTKPNKITTNYIDSGNKIKSIFIEKGNNSNLSNHLTEKINTLSSLIFSNKMSESNNHGIFSNDFLNDYLNFGANKLKVDALSNNGIKSFIKVVENNNSSVRKQRNSNENRKVGLFLKLNEKNGSSIGKVFNNSTKTKSFIGGIKKRKVANRDKNGNESTLKNEGKYITLINSYYRNDNFNLAKNGNLYAKNNFINTIDKENINGFENQIIENIATKSANGSRIYKKKEKSAHKNCLCQQRRETKKPKSYLTNLTNSNNGLLVLNKKNIKINENNQKNIDQIKRKKTYKKIKTNLNSNNISINNSNINNHITCNHLTDINDDICAKFDLLTIEDEINEMDEFSSSMSQKKKVVKSLKIKPNAEANRLKNFNNNKLKIKPIIFNNNQKNIVNNNKFRINGLNKKSNTSIACFGQKINNNNDIEKNAKEQIKESKNENIKIKKIPKIRPPNNYKNSKKLNILSLIQENNQKIRKKSFPKCTPKKEENCNIQNVLYDNNDDSSKKEYFDNFDGIYTIIKKINFDEVNIQSNNIFTTNPKMKNNLYDEYDQIFTKYFVNNIVNKKKIVNYMSGNIHTSRISGSTKENSSKGKKTSVSYLFEKN